MTAEDLQLGGLDDQQTYLRALAHEMKTPLAVMKGFLQTMQVDVMNPVMTRQHIGQVAQELARLSAIVEDVALRLRVESDLLALRPAPVNIQTIVDYALNDARATFCGREFASETTTTLPLVTVDQYMLHVLLMTLLYNGARRRVDDDEPVTLRIVVTETGLEFCVDDGLAPLPADIVDGLFEPRPELPRALHLPQFGLGLRLYAARRIARQMGGELEIVPGQGNRYQLRLPLQPPADDSTEAEI